MGDSSKLLNFIHTCVVLVTPHINLITNPAVMIRHSSFPKGTVVNPCWTLGQCEHQPVAETATILLMNVMYCVHVQELYFYPTLQLSAQEGEIACSRSPRP